MKVNVEFSKSSSIFAFTVNTLIVFDQTVTPKVWRSAIAIEKVHNLGGICLLIFDATTGVLQMISNRLLKLNTQLSTTRPS